VPLAVGSELNRDFLRIALDPAPLQTDIIRVRSVLNFGFAESQSVIDDNSCATTLNLIKINECPLWGLKVATGSPNVVFDPNQGMTLWRSAIRAAPGVLLRRS
jgi:hypothetical protein